MPVAAHPVLIEQLQHGFDLGAPLTVQLGDLDDVAVVGQAVDEGFRVGERRAGGQIAAIAPDLDHGCVRVLQGMAQEIDRQQRDALAHPARWGLAAPQRHRAGILRVAVLRAQIAPETQDVGRILGLLQFDQELALAARRVAHPSGEVHPVDRQHPLAGTLDLAGAFLGAKLQAENLFLQNGPDQQLGQGIVFQQILEDGVIHGIGDVAHGYLGSTGNHDRACLEMAPTGALGRPRVYHPPMAARSYAFDPVCFERL